MDYEEFVNSLNDACVVDFWAEWCPPCKAFAPIFDRVSKNFDDINFIKINVDESQKLCDELGIMSIPTVQFYFHGSLSDEANSFSNEKEFTDFIENNIY